jgi:hypothetical protein
VRELATLRCRDHSAIIATSLLYLQPKFELASRNTCDSVVVRVNYALLLHHKNGEVTSLAKFCNQVLCQAEGGNYIGWVDRKNIQ